ncbi:MAG: hypothetical protein KME18_18115 [Phormidium tanganyikae FI6-MK23]|jgi:hypothetical protein|nr:hypothetical protein [Phormidium tanganyikae FI6-MK23]
MRLNERLEMRVNQWHKDAMHDRAKELGFKTAPEMFRAIVEGKATVKFLGEGK